jgi:hypothetical protein
MVRSTHPTDLGINDRRPKPWDRSNDDSMTPPLDLTTPSSDLPSSAGPERRTLPDRRNKPTGPWGAFWPTGRRRALRRAAEHCRPYFVDRFSPTTFVLIVLLLAATVVDAVLTIHLLRAGAEEMNPLMEGLLHYGVQRFVVVKYLLTATGLPLLLIYQHHRLFGTRVRVAHLLPVAVALYGVLIGYQVLLLHVGAL